MDTFVIRPETRDYTSPNSLSSHLMVYLSFLFRTVDERVCFMFPFSCSTLSFIFLCENIFFAFLS